MEETSARPQHRRVAWRDQTSLIRYQNEAGIKACLQATDWLFEEKKAGSGEAARETI